MSNVDQLKDMFPSIDVRTIEALVIASQGALEPATNALLYLSDPNSHIEVPSTLQDSVPPPPPRPSAAEMERRKQMQADEELAKKLARSYQRKPQPRRPQQADVQEAGAVDDNNDDDDIVETLRDNLNEAKNVVGGWLDNVAKKLQGDVPEQRRPIQYNDNIKPHYQEDTTPPRLPVRKSTGQLYSALDAGSSENTHSHLNDNVNSNSNTAITLQDVTGDDDGDDEKDVEKVQKETQVKPDMEKMHSSKNDKKWEQLTEVAPEPTVGTSKINANANASANADDSGFVVDDSEEEDNEDETEEQQKVEEKPVETKEP